METTLLNITLLLSATYYLLGAFVIKTENMASSIMFKLIPFVFGTGLLFQFLKNISAI